MPIYILYDYKNMIKKISSDGKKNNYNEYIELLGIKVVIALIIMLITGIGTVVLYFTKAPYLISVISFLIEISCAVYITWSFEILEIKNSTENYKSFLLHLEKINSWLYNLGFTKRKQIAQLCFRCEKEIAENRSDVERIKSHLEKILGFILIPAILLLITSLVNGFESIAEQIPVVITGIVITIVIYVFIYGTTGIIDKIINKDYFLMKSMVKKFEAILDLEFLFEDDDGCNN